MIRESIYIDMIGAGIISQSKMRFAMLLLGKGIVCRCLCSNIPYDMRRKGKGNIESMRAPSPHIFLPEGERADKDASSEMEGFYLEPVQGHVFCPFVLLKAWLWAVLGAAACGTCFHKLCST